MKKYGYIGIILLFLFVLYKGMTEPALSAGFTGKFMYMEPDEYFKGLCLSVDSEKNKFYIFETPLVLPANQEKVVTNFSTKGEFQRMDLKNYILEGPLVEKQRIQIDRGRFALFIDGKEYVFEKVSENRFIPMDIFEEAYTEDFE
ncbi:MAG: hypothetical protein IKI88_04660 [Anaerotignum sp.]|nr:hypothetical protein [Anaerotignum sp.]